MFTLRTFAESDPGKTLTAESVAEILHRPLYIVGSSELPSTASQLEYSLKVKLSVSLWPFQVAVAQSPQLATAWDAVLLIDEADVRCRPTSNSFFTNSQVYLEQRSLHEVMTWVSNSVEVTADNIISLNEMPWFQSLSESSSIIVAFCSLRLIGSKLLMKPSSPGFRSPLNTPNLTLQVVQLFGASSSQWPDAR